MIFLSENFQSIKFSEVMMNNPIGIWYSSRDGADRSEVRLSKDTSTYRHRDVRYGHSSQPHKAQVVQHHCITPGQHQHVTISKETRHVPTRPFKRDNFNIY